MAFRKGLWLPNNSYLPQDDRLGLTSLWYPSGSSTTPLTARSGVLTRANASSHGPLQVIAATGMSATVTPGQMVYQGTNSNVQGAYVVTNDANTSVSFNTSDPSNPRIDVVYVLVTDTLDGGATDNTQPLVQAGTPAASPTAPSIPTGAQALAWVTVRAGTTSILGSDIADKRTFTTTYGDWLPVANFAALPANPYECQKAYLLDVHVPVYYNGSNWQRVAGYVDEVTRGANIGSITTTETICDTDTFSAINGQRYKVTYQVAVQSTSSTTFTLRLRKANGSSVAITDTSIRVNATLQIDTVNQWYDHILVATFVSSTTGNVTVGGSLLRTGAGGTLTASGTTSQGSAHLTIEAM